MLHNAQVARGDTVRGNILYELWMWIESEILLFPGILGISYNSL